MKRLTRKEQQAHTRACLLHAAARVFSRHGLAQSSVEQVASEAGFTKGAFYANFKSKEELFLAILDERYAERVRVLDEIMQEGGSMEEQARASGAEFQDYIRGDPEWDRLFFEFSAHAARDDGFRQELIARYRTLIERIAVVAEQRLRAAGIEPPGDPVHFARAVFAAGNGVALQQLLDPEDTPVDLFAWMLELLTLGVLVKTGALSAAPGAADPAAAADPLG